MWTLGINWNFHDTSAALVDGAGVVWAMAEEERFTRAKHAFDVFPVRSTAFCLEQAGISWQDLDAVAVGWDMNLYEPWPESGTVRLFEQLFGAKAPGEQWPELVFVAHHLAHASVAFHGSGYDQAAVLVMDGSGEHSSISIYGGDRNRGLELKRTWGRKHSLGALYEATTQAIGFGELSGGKVMGLASYAPSFVDDLVRIDALLAGSDACPPWHSPESDPEDDECVATWRRYLEDRFGRVTSDQVDVVDDPVALQLAGSAQFAVETTSAALHAEARRLTGFDAVCLSGGVSLNCVSNGLLPEPLFVPPVPYDAGVALGAAWQVSPPAIGAELSPYLGSEVGPVRLPVGSSLRARDFDAAEVADLLGRGAVGAVAAGRAEIGPRALGHRSILALPSPASVLTELNRRKGREHWRPLAPVARLHDAGRFWPDQGSRARYMVGSVQVHDDVVDLLPASVHVDGSTRPLALRLGEAPVVESILGALDAQGLPPVMVNTSFNGRDEPIVDNAADALATFGRLGLDFLVLDDLLVTPLP